MKRRLDPVHVHRVLEQERALAEDLFCATEEEQRAAARALGFEHHLPEPQQLLPLPEAWST
jgi:hypothetical protein